MNTKNKVVKTFIIFGCVLTLALYLFLCIPVVKFLNNRQALENYIESFGAFMPLVYILMVILQIFIPFIPGEPFEIMAGYLFGSALGSVIAIFAESVASVIIILLVRKYGIRLVQLFFKDKDINKLAFLNNQKWSYLFAILFIIPGTPKDLLCYVSGLMNFKLIPLLIISTIGRIPSIITSTIPGGAIGSSNYKLAIIVYGITIVVSLLGIYFYNKITKENKY